MAIVSYQIYDNSDGEIRFSGVADEANIPPVGPGQTLAKGDPLIPLGAPSTHRIDLTTGKAVPLTTILPVNDKISSLAKSCTQTIEGGFMSQALGAPHLYKSAPVDQTKLLFGGSIYCRDVAGNWARLPHDVDQSAAVRNVFVALYDAAMTRLDLLTAQVNAATTQAELDTIQWSVKSGDVIADTQAQAASAVAKEPVLSVAPQKVVAP